MEKICMCKCNEEETVVMHMFPCCDFEGEKYIKKDGEFDKEKYNLLNLLKNELTISFYDGNRRQNSPLSDFEKESLIENIKICKEKSLTNGFFYSIENDQIRISGSFNLLK